MIVEKPGEIIEFDPAWLGRRRDFEIMSDHPQLAVAALQIDRNLEEFKRNKGVFAPMRIVQTVIIHKPGGKKQLAKATIEVCEVQDLIPQGGGITLFKGNGIMTIEEISMEEFDAF